MLVYNVLYNENFGDILKILTKPYIDEYPLDMFWIDIIRAKTFNKKLDSKIIGIIKIHLYGKMEIKWKLYKKIIKLCKN